MSMSSRPFSLVVALAAPFWLAIQPAAQAPARPAAPAASTIPRTPDGKPNLQGIWQVRNRASYDLQDHAARYGMPGGKGVVEGRDIPYQPWAAAKKLENYTKRLSADPLAKCFMPGVPRIM